MTAYLPTGSKKQKKKKKKKNGWQSRTFTPRRGSTVCRLALSFLACWEGEGRVKNYEMRTDQLPNRAL